MHIDMEDFRAASRKLDSAIENFRSEDILNSLDFWKLPSSLASVQSFNEQLSALMNGFGGLKTSIKWHIQEAECVSTALKSMSRAMCYVDLDTKLGFDGTYDRLAVKGDHTACVVPDLNNLGKGYNLPGNRTFLSYAPHGIPLQQEIIGRDIETLLRQFAEVTPTAFQTLAINWNKVSGTLLEFSQAIHHGATAVRECGSEDAYTYHASLGIHRWADSIYGLGKQVKGVAHNIDAFSANYSDTQGELEEIATRRHQAQQHTSYQQYSFPETQFTNRANTVLTGTYNPGLSSADTKAIEFAVPLRAVQPERYEPILHSPKAPALPPLIAIPNITTNPAESTPQATTPEAPAPPTENLRDYQPPKGTEPAPTTPNGTTEKPTPPNTGTTPSTPSGIGATNNTPTTHQPTSPATAPTNPAFIGHDTGRKKQQDNQHSYGIYNPGYTADKGSWRGNEPKPWVVPRMTPPSTYTPDIRNPIFDPRMQEAYQKLVTERRTPDPLATDGRNNAYHRGGHNPSHSASHGTEQGPRHTAGQSNGGRPGMPGMGSPGAPGTAGESRRGRSTLRRPRRSENNTNRILPQPGHIRGPIRHPDDPLFGTGR